MEPLQEELSTEPPKWIDPTRRRRALLTAVAVLPVVVTLLVAVAQQPLVPTWVFPCPLHPDGTVAFTSVLHDACPLEHSDRVDAVVREGRAEPIRTAREVQREIASGLPRRFRIQPQAEAARELLIAPVRIWPSDAALHLAAASTLAGILVAAVLLTAVGAEVLASLPFVLIHSAAGVAILSTVAGWAGAAFQVVDSLARATMAGAVMHLALVFPERRGTVERSPELIALPYAFAYGAGALEIYAAYGESAASLPLAQHLLMPLIVLAVGALAAGCYRTARRSSSHLARAQARVFLAGIALVAMSAGAVWLSGPPRLRLAAVTILAALLPFAVAYAIARDDVSDLAPSLRRWVARGLHLSLWSVVCFIALVGAQDRRGLPPVLGHPTVAFATIYCALVPLELARSGVKRIVRRLIAIQAVDWERLGRKYAQRIAAERSAEGIAREVGEAIRSGLGSGTGVALLLAHHDALRVVEAVGTRSFVDPSLIGRLVPAPGEPVVDLNRAAHLRGPGREARDSGIGALARLEAGDRFLGCIVLLHERRTRVLGAGERAWVAAVAGHAATVLAGLRFEQQLRVAERFAARGRMEAELAHDIGKPLGALELTTQKLTELLDPCDPIVPQLKKITQLARLVRDLARVALRRYPAKSRPRLEDLVEVSCLEVHAIHGEQRILVHELPDLGELPLGFERLTRVLVNLLDNAIRASEPGQVVELHARVESGCLELRIDDRGHGMTRDQLRRAFEPFASFRPDGNGLGLSISRQIVTTLGGSLSLTPRADGRGVRALARLPLSQ